MESANKQSEGMGWGDPLYAPAFRQSRLPASPDLSETGLVYETGVCGSERLSVSGVSVKWPDNSMAAGWISECERICRREGFVR